MIITLLILPLFYYLIWQFRFYILGIIIGIFLNYILLALLKNISLEDKQYIRWKFMFSILDFIKIYLSIPIGVIKGLTRLIIIICIACATGFITC